MPDPRRLYSRLTDTSLVSRAFSHLMVVGLVVTATAFGISAARADRGDGSSADSAFFSIVSTARGSAPGADPLRSTTLDLQPAPVDPPELVARGAPGRVPAFNQPLPTPVPLDPNQTPLPAPANAVGQAQTFASGGAAGPVAPVGSGALAWPVPAGSVSQYFHAGHLAVDIAAPYGSTVVAAQAGAVTAAGWHNNGGGIVVTIDHGNGIVTSYNHLGAPWVSVGQAVGAGEGIGAVGCTGICTGPHVHFVVMVNGVIQNPLRYL